jgi:hypothetical protein
MEKKTWREIVTGNPGLHNWIKDNLAADVLEELMRTEDQKFHAGEPEHMEPARPFERIALEAVDQPLQAKACDYVYKFIRARLDKSDRPITFPISDVYVVWFTKVLQNWHCLISTTLPDGMYYDVVFDGNKQVVHLIAYKKDANFVFSDNQLEHVANFQPAQQAKFRVMMYIKHEIPGYPKNRRFNEWDVIVLWLSEVMQNWKAVAFSGLADDLLFEITYNGDKTETYVDVYKKWKDVRIAEGEDSA